MRTLLSLVTLTAVFAVACGGDGSSPGSTSGGNTQSGQGGSSSGGVFSATGGAANSGGSVTGGAATASGGTSTGGSPESQGGAVTGGADGKSGAPAATGGSDGVAGSGGTTGGATGGSGGNGKATGGVVGAGGVAGGATSSGGAGGSANSGGAAGTGGSSNAGACTRELLKSTLDAYYEALAAHDPSSLPLADNVKFTENGKAMKMGDQGMWKSAGALKYSHNALDTQECTAASQAVVPDGTMDIPFALRIKVQSQKISEVETIAVRPGDYKVSGQNFASNTAALIASATSVKWQDVVPAADRNTRAEITGWMDKYYRLFPRGVCNTTSACKRIENGGGSFSCSSGASCDAGTGSGQPALPSRLILADVETGLGVGFTMFQGNTDMHMFKMFGGQVHGVSAILGAASSSGWD